MSKLSRAIKYVMAIWLLALCLAVPQAIQFGVVYQKLTNGTLIESSATCSVKPTSIRHAFEISSILFFAVPMLVILVLYVLIGLKLKNTRLLKNRHQHHHPTAVLPNHEYSNNFRSKTGNAQKNVIRMLGNAKIDNAKKFKVEFKNKINFAVAVVVAFFICWAPFHAQRLLAVYAEKHKKDEQKTSTVLPFYTVLTYVSGIFYYLSTTINPLLYNIMSNKFREAFKVSIPSFVRNTNFYFLFYLLFFI